MSDQLSKVDPNLAHVLQGLHDVLYSGDWSLPDDTQQQLEGIYEDGKNRIESAAAPVEVDGLTPYARGVAAINSLDDFARMDAGVDPVGPRAAAFSALDELARQLAEAERHIRVRESDFSQSEIGHEEEITALQSALSEATRRLGEVEGLLRRHISADVDADTTLYAETKAALTKEPTK